MLLSESHSLKALFPIVSVAAGIVIVFRFLHLLKANCPIDLMSSCITISLMAEELKVLEFIFLTPFGISTRCNEAPMKADEPIESTVEGIANSTSWLVEQALSPMTRNVEFSANSTLNIPVLLLCILRLVILVTVLGTITRCMYLALLLNLLMYISVTVYSVPSMTVVSGMFKIVSVVAFSPLTVTVRASWLLILYFIMSVSSAWTVCAAAVIDSTAIMILLNFIA